MSRLRQRSQGVNCWIELGGRWLAVDVDDHYLRAIQFEELGIARCAGNAVVGCGLGRANKLTSRIRVGRLALLVFAGVRCMQTSETSMHGRGVAQVPASRDQPMPLRTAQLSTRSDDSCERFGSMMPVIDRE